LEHTDGVEKAEFSEDGKFILTITHDETRLWNSKTGKMITMSKDLGKFSPDGKYIATSEGISDAANAILLRAFNTKKIIQPLEWSRDGKYVITSSSETIRSSSETAIIWSAVSGKLLHTLGQNGARPVSSAKFDRSGNQLVLVSRNTQILDISKAELSKTLQTDYAEFAEFSPDGKYVCTAGNGPCSIWDAISGKLLQVLYDTQASDSILFLDYHPPLYYDRQSLQFSADSKLILAGSRFSNPKIWQMSSGKMIQMFFGFDDPEINDVCWSPDGSKIACATANAFLYDSNNNTPSQKLNLDSKEYSGSVKFSPDGKLLATAAGFKLKVWDVSTGQLVYNFSQDSISISSARFSPDGKYIVTAGNGFKSFVWDLSTGKLVSILDHNTSPVFARFSFDSNHVITASIHEVKIWGSQGREMLKTIKTNGFSIADVSPDFSKFVCTNASSLKIFDIQKGMELFTYVAIDSSDWVVTHPSGLFDASPGAMDKLYFVQGLDIIDLKQLKARYYEPGLWKKVMAGEKLREVVGMKAIDLPPDVRVGAVDSKGYLPIELTNRGGGIGEVAVYIFGKEVTKDARAANTDPNAPSLKLNYYIGNHKSLVKGENYITVKAWNKDHWVESRGELITYQHNVAEKETYTPAIHILTVGVSDYTGNEIDLKYAAKDAEDVSKALQLGATKLFGTSKSYVYNLTTNLSDKEQWPTKKSILTAFEKISTTAHPLDVVVVYLSGHGINISSGQEGDWHYLAQDAYSASSSAYSDPAILNQTTLSSNELVELFKKIPAAKQVLMIDACASGKVVENLMAKKDISSSTLRALDRMKDRTGMHIITGCTADAVSYEASRYGQGVLTYSLLEGIRGAALREDQFVDVNKLFQYAQDRVPALATGIGGIQTPMVFSPNGSQSFDMGQLNDEQKKNVPIAKIRPVYIRSNFQDENELEDVQGLGKKVDDLLNEASAKGAEAPLIFVDVREYPEGCKLNGLYKKENEKIALKLKKRCEGKELIFNLTGTDASDLSNQIAWMIKQ
jgi:WD40 repeat protein